MNCPEDEIIERLVEGELSDSEKSQLADHISKCKSCREKYERDKLFYLGLEKAFADDECPDEGALEAYLEGNLPDARKKDIEDHLVTCHECETHLGFLKNPEKIGKWKEREEEFFRLAEAEELAREVAQRIERELFPRAGLLDRIWATVCSLFEQLRKKDISQWNGIVADKATAGAIGFAGGMPPEVEATAIMSLTVLGMADRLAEGEELDLEESADELSKVFGAGSALRRRLKEVAPAAFREAMKEREM